MIPILILMRIMLTAEESRNDEQQKDIVNSVLHAGVAIMKVRLKAIEDESKAKDLQIEELESEVN